MPRQAKERIFYLDFLRVLAIAAVVMIHVAEQNWELLRVGSPEHIILTIFDGVVRFAVPVFVMISGALMLKRDLSPLKLLKKVGKLAVAWIIWCVIYAAMALISGKGKEVALNELMFGHFHMWFIVMVVVLYLVTPILREVAKRPRWCLILVLLLLIFSVAARFRWTTYPMFYLLGYMLSQGWRVLSEAASGKAEKTGRRVEAAMPAIFSVLFLAATAAIVGLNLKASFAEGAAIRPEDADWSIFTMIQSVAIFMIVKNLVEGLKNVGVEQKICSHLAQDVLGVYLVHIAVLGVLNRLKISNLMFVKFVEMTNFGGDGVAREVMLGIATIGGQLLTVALVTVISFGLVEIYHKAAARIKARG